MGVESTMKRKNRAGTKSAKSTQGTPNTIQIPRRFAVPSSGWSMFPVEIWDRILAYGDNIQFRRLLEVCKGCYNVYLDCIQMVSLRADRPFVCKFLGRCTNSKVREVQLTLSKGLDNNLAKALCQLDPQKMSFFYTMPGHVDFAFASPAFWFAQLDLHQCPASLRCLELNVGIEAVNLPHLKSLSHLEEFGVRDNRKADNVYLGELLRCLPESVRKLRLNGTVISDLSPFAEVGLPLLTSLNLSSSSRVSDLRGLRTSLTELDLSDTNTSPGSIKHIILKMKNLKVLELKNCSLTDRILSSLSVLTNLEKLSFGGRLIGITREITDNTLQILSLTLPKLRYLHTTNTKITESGIYHLTNLSNLQYVVMGKCYVADVNRCKAALSHVRSWYINCSTPPSM
eukprot:TRINITY_DN8622_c0_g2_i1.p1 TRINITY_DN8622_c0_g2~~TRINITY_DN8622_c0_g2_i1.p1  ORF type:complete len:399 (+),score=65.46 TRINITY_DN8622_c0_g2_i1:231-1427(+)